MIIVLFEWKDEICVERLNVETKQLVIHCDEKFRIKVTMETSLIVFGWNFYLTSICCYFRKSKNLFEALYKGAIDGLKICGYIVANILTILCVLALVNNILKWLGELADIEGLSFQVSTSL